MKGGHFISLADFTSDELRGVLDLAKRLKALKVAGAPHRLLDGKVLGMLFQKPSNRTRISFEVGMYDLGGSALNLRPDEINMGVRESVADVAQVLSRYVDAVMMRVLDHRDIQEFARYSKVPVVNGLSDVDHPCQAISDMLTVEEHKGSLAGKRFCYVGDGNNVCVALIHACKKLGLSMVVSCPHGYEPPLDRTEWSYELIHNAEHAVSGADVIYTDVWISMGQEKETELRLRRFAEHSVTPALMRAAAPNAIFMHCLPAHRGEEVDAEVMDGPQSVVFDQAENRLHVQKAVLCRLFGADLPAEGALS